MTASRSPDRRQKTILVALAMMSLLMTLLIAAAVLKQSRTRTAAPAASQPQATQGGILDSADGDTRPPVLATLPPFSLVERTGDAVTLDSMRGKIWIAAFIFTQCQGPCPTITSQMYLLQQRIMSDPALGARDDIRLVSLSVDPENDTPAALTEYARIAHARPDRWLFLTGTRGDMWSLISNGFKLPVGEDDADPKMPIFHSQRLALIDRRGRVRGYHEALDPAAREALWENLKALLAEK